MNLDLGPAFTRAQAVVNSLVAAIPGISVALVVFGGFSWWRQSSRESSRDSPRRGSMHIEMREWPSADSLKASSSFSVCSSRSPSPCRHSGRATSCRSLASAASPSALRSGHRSEFSRGHLLLVTQPLRIGDQIVASNYEGTIEDIQTRATFIRTYDGRGVMVPNADLFTDTVVVNTAFEHRRLEYEVGIGYSDDIDRARGLILEAVRGTEGVLAEPRA